jgi:hypothetical protein
MAVPSARGNAMQPSPTLSRQFWQAVEPLHAVVYFHPDPPAALAGQGLKGFWMAYFAARFGPLGPIGPEPVTALAFNFSPRRPARALPDAWALAAPAEVVGTWMGSAADVLREVLPTAGEGAVTSPEELAELADLLVSAAKACHCDGRALAAAWQAVEPGDDVYARLWWGATVVREHRGDGHVAAATALGLRGLDAAITHAAWGAAPPEGLQHTRGWTDDEWAAGRRRLVDKEQLEEDGGLSTKGTENRLHLESLTDFLAEDPIDALGTGAVGRALELAVPLARHLYDSRIVNLPNPIGTSRP